MFAALLVRVVALLPLGALCLFPAGSQLRWLALLCPVLLIFLVLPLRFSFAQALAWPADGRRFSFRTAFSFSNYGEKLSESLLHALHIFKWGIPLWLMLGGVYYAYNQIDMITLMGGLSDIGAGVTTAEAAVGNFFIGIFGGAQIVPNGGLMEGLYAVVGVLGLGLLILLWGVVRNSAFRYVWAVTPGDRNPHAEARRSLRGRRWDQLGIAIVNLILWAPALYVTFSALKDVLGDLSDAIFTLMSTEQASLPEFSGAVGPLLFAFLVCYMPLLPVRRILTSAFAVRHTHYAAGVRVNENEYEPVPAYRPNGEEAARQGYLPYQGAQPQPVYRPYQPKENAEEPAPADETAQSEAPADHTGA